MFTATICMYMKVKLPWRSNINDGVCVLGMFALGVFACTVYLKGGTYLIDIATIRDVYLRKKLTWLAWEAVIRGQVLMELMK